MAGRLVRLRAVADAFDQLDVRDAVLDGQRLRELPLVLVHVVRAAAGDGEIVAADRHGAAVDLGETHHIRAGQEFAQVAVLVELGRPHQRAGFHEAPRVHHLVDAFPDRVAPAAVLAFDALGPTHFRRQRLDVGDVVDRLLPGHAWFPAFVFGIDGHGGLRSVNRVRLGVHASA